MEIAIEKLRAEIGNFLIQLHLKRKAYEELMGKDEILAKTKDILKEIKHLEKTIIEVVEAHLLNHKKD